MATTTEHKTEEEPDYVCPKGHHLPCERWNYARDDSDDSVDADGKPMYESGLWCHTCSRAYGLSKLVNANSACQKRQ